MLRVTRHESELGRWETVRRDPEGNSWSFGTYQPFAVDHQGKSILEVESGAVGLTPHLLQGAGHADEAGLRCAELSVGPRAPSATVDHSVSPLRIDRRSKDAPRASEG